jgi:hypothetical protein
VISIGRAAGAHAERAGVSDLRRRLDGARPAADEEAMGGSPDYLFIRRHVPAHRGKWRIVSKEAEEADREED